MSENRRCTITPTIVEMSIGPDKLSIIERMSQIEDDFEKLKETKQYDSVSLHPISLYEPINVKKSFDEDDYCTPVDETPSSDSDIESFSPRIEYATLTSEPENSTIFERSLHTNDDDDDDDDDDNETFKFNHETVVALMNNDEPLLNFEMLNMPKTYLNCLNRIINVKREKDDIAVLSPHACYSKYMPLSILGFGESSYVVLAKTKKINSYDDLLLAFKITFTRSNEKNMVEESIKLLYKLTHPNIVKMIDSFKMHQFYVQKFEFLPYGTLNTLLSLKELTRKLRSDKGELKGLEMVRLWSAQILMALDYLHKKGYFHGRIRTENIGIGYCGYLKLIHFKMTDEIRISSKESKGMPMGLDMAKNDIICFSDVYKRLFQKLILKAHGETLTHNEHKELNEQMYQVFESIAQYNTTIKDALVPNAEELLLNYGFYRNVDKVRLLMQNINLENEFNLDLKKLFVYTQDRIHQIYSKSIGPEYPRCLDSKLFNEAWVNQVREQTEGFNM